MYDVDELVDACKLSAKHNRQEPIAYDVNHPLVGHAALAPVFDSLKQVRYNRFKLQNRYQKIKSRNRSQISHFSQFPLYLFL